MKNCQTVWNSPEYPKPRHTQASMSFTDILIRVLAHASWHPLMLSSFLGKVKIRMNACEQRWDKRIKYTKRYHGNNHPFLQFIFAKPILMINTLNSHF